MTEERTNLSDLAARIEAAEGPDRELDAEIWLACNRPDWRKRKDWRKTNGWATKDRPSSMVSFYTPDGLGGSLTASRYTASVDAALTLVDAETEPLDILEAALQSARDAREGVYFLPLHVCAAALRAKEVSDHG